jgi:hypothetical protein
MNDRFEANDSILEQLVKARREEVVQLQQSQADQLQDLEARGQSRIANFRKTLPREILTVLESQEKAGEEMQAATQSRVDESKARLVESTPARTNETAFHPGLAGGQLIAPNSLGWFSPYYGTLHGSNGAVYWQGSNPGNIDLSDWASGAGWGCFGTGVGAFTVYMDWWFTYVPTANRNYAHTIYVPFHGFYIVIADDGFWDCKDAHVRIDLSAIGYQYNYKALSTTNVFDLSGSNINVNDRLDGWRTMYYSDLLGADRAYLRVTASFYVYAHGGGSYAELNFGTGNANYIGMPWIYVD